LHCVRSWHVPSFPTRRSSDLSAEAGLIAVAALGQVVSQGAVAESGATPPAVDNAATPAHADGGDQDTRAGLIVAATLSTVSGDRSEEHTSELQSRVDLVCRLL